MRPLALAFMATLAAAGPASAQTYSFSTLATFTGTNGANPIGGLAIDGAGNLFGTTSSGGTSGSGTVFGVAAGSGTVTTLATFTGTNGANPQAGPVLDGAGNLFGTTFTGGGGSGTVFEVAAGSGTVTTLATFTGTNGANPIGGLAIDGSGNLFGTTLSGGASSVGTVFEVAAGSGTVTTLATFTGTNGANPQAGPVLDGAGNLFGVTFSGGASSAGTVFEVAAGSGTVTTLATFNNTNGASPIGGLVLDGAGNLFGTTLSGGASNAGTVFVVTAGSGTVTTLATFNGTNGSNPIGGLVLDGAGNLFGTTNGGGASGSGTVFEVAAGSGTVTTLVSFTGTNGANPQAGPVLDGAGNLFGTTAYGGANGNGTVFQLSPTPEPATMLGLSAAGLGLAGWVRRRRAAADRTRVLQPGQR